MENSLLDLGFSISNVFANNGIKFLDCHLVWHVALVLVSCVKVSGACTGNQSDFISHRFCLLNWL